MLRYLVPVLVLSGGLGADSATAQPTGSSAFAQYQQHVQVSIFICRMQFARASAQAEIVQLNPQSASPPKDTDEDPGKCISRTEGEAKPLLRAAIAKAKAPSQKAALASYHAGFVAALRGILPAGGERKFQYEARQATLTDKLNAAEALLTAEGVE